MWCFHENWKCINTGKAPVPPYQTVWKTAPLTRSKIRFRWRFQPTKHGYRDTVCVHVCTVQCVCLGGYLMPQSRMGPWGPSVRLCRSLIVTCRMQRKPGTSLSFRGGEQCDIYMCSAEEAEELWSQHSTDKRLDKLWPELCPDGWSRRWPCVCVSVETLAAYKGKRKRMDFPCLYPGLWRMTVLMGIDFSLR